MSGPKSLMDIVKEKAQEGELQLPASHQVALQLQQILNREDFQIKTVAKLILEDQALSSQILRVANTAFFSGLGKASTVRDAIVRIGAKEVANIAMMVSQKSLHTSSDAMINGYMHSIWQHALGCALGSKWLAKKLGYRELMVEAFMAGLLHDIGRLFLLKVLDEVKTSDDHELTLTEPLVQEVLDSMHCEQGYRLMQQWNLPDVYCNIARDHDLDSFDSDDVLLAMVRLVNMGCWQLGIGMRSDPSVVLAATPEADALGAKEILLAQLEVAIEDAMQLV